MKTFHIKQAENSKHKEIETFLLSSVFYLSFLDLQTWIFLYMCPTESNECQMDDSFHTLLFVSVATSFFSKVRFIKIFSNYEENILGKLHW